MMRSIFYVVLPAAAVLIIMANAFFGHMLFVPDPGQATTKYSVYVHFQPEWDSHPNNLIFEVTNSWHVLGAQDTRHENATYNENRLQTINGRQYVELMHGFSDCQDEWTPTLYGRAIDTVRHWTEYLQGAQLSTNPDISVYPDVSSMHDASRDVFVQFIPICTSDERTSYNYSIRSDNTGFDMYFVSSDMQRHEFYKASFAPYTDSGCSAVNKKSISGTCKNIDHTGGLLIIVPDKLDSWVTNITVNLYEI